MRFLLRAIFFGVLTGAFLFYFPFHFFLFPVLLLFVAGRIFFRPWRWRHRFHGYGSYGTGMYGGHRFAGFDPMNDDAGFSPVMPIDGFGGGARRGRNTEKEKNINIQ